jgi:hypothetical protein
LSNREDVADFAFKITMTIAALLIAAALVVAMRVTLAGCGV